ncbi:D-glycero-beta-D-manno-heptose 1-phosphate adenylyltransferase [Microlunatus flavus]|uniref:D-glycero-beta-D-manno-heptose 1-phosphate adenylyltransferase n=1 Tax=Microlunatus flavus TaxID=1036181 RepID=A0A1H8ZL14_9ACTN|nr:D-glycero-beta-D-manno-heptose 1-phosphate adenylyltransferase [Microlunatus flavus]SEP64953.1 rfaE bifunctional protein, domain II [Microlunatus flavus]
MTGPAATRGPLLVVGDTLLDVDLEGSSDRLAPDAPVPVVDVTHEWQRPGGAGLAALLAARSGHEVVLLTALGADESADRVRQMLGELVEVVALPLSGATSRKTRVLANGVPVTRLDVGSGRALDAPLPPAAHAAIERAGAVLVADYGRGVTGLDDLREHLTERARAIPVVWDPHPRGSAPVPGCALVTPNASEARALGGVDGTADQGRVLARLWQARGIVVTLGARGALLVQGDTETLVPLDDPEAEDRPAGGRAPHAGRLDTCGAGDAFATAAAVALLEGQAPYEGVRTAVGQATAFVRAGAATAVSTEVPYAGSSDRPEPADAFRLVEQVRAAGGTVVATGGCFDLLHRGHVSLLSAARSLGDALVVCLNSDASVRRGKGADRPLVTQEDRARVLSALASVDGVVVFDEDTPAEVLARLRPDVWVKGSDYTDQPIPEAAVVEAAGGRVVLLPVVDGYSTTRLVDASRAAGTPSTSTTNQHTEEN